MNLPLGFKPIDLELLEALPECSIVYLYDKDTQMTTTHTVCFWDGKLVLTEIMTGIGFHETDILRCDGYASPSDLFPPIPYGEWLTGNVELLESLTIQDTEVYCYFPNDPDTRWVFYLYPETENEYGCLTDGNESYSFEEFANKFVYQILRPIPNK